MDTIRQKQKNWDYDYYNNAPFVAPLIEFPNLRAVGTVWVYRPRIMVMK